MLFVTRCKRYGGASRQVFEMPTFRGNVTAATRAATDARSGMTALARKGYSRQTRMALQLGDPVDHFEERRSDGAQPE